MDNKKEKLENFKTAISSTVRSLSNSQKLQVHFGNGEIQSDKNSIKLPNLDYINNKINFEEIRALADSKSLNIRFSNKKILKKYEPKGNISKKLYDISEKIRCEKIGTSYFKGVKSNIEKFYHKKISNLDLKNSEEKMIESFENFLRTNFLDFKTTPKNSIFLFAYNKSNNSLRSIDTYEKTWHGIYNSIQFKNEIVGDNGKKIKKLYQEISDRHLRFVNHLVIIKHYITFDTLKRNYTLINKQGYFFSYDKDNKNKDRIDYKNYGHSYIWMDFLEEVFS